MNVAWDNITSAQQTRFLAAAGLQKLPEPLELDDRQWQILTGIVGEELAGKIRQEAQGGTLFAPVLAAPGIGGDWSAIMAAVAELQAKTSQIQIDASSETLAAQKADIERANAEAAAKIKESLAKLEKARKTGLLGKIFGWIGAVVGLIGAAVATVATGGAAWPALALAVVGVGMMALQEAGAMDKIVNFLAEKPLMLMLVLGPVAGSIIGGLIKGGVIPEEHAKTAIAVTFAVSMLVASVAGMVASGGASASNVVFKVMGLVGQIAGGLASTGSGASGVAGSVYNYQAEQAKADTQEMNAWLAKIQQMFAEESDRLQELIEKLNSGAADASEIIAGIGKSHQAITSNIGV